MTDIRVLMLLTPGVSFVDDWARAAGTVADVEVLTIARRSGARKNRVGEDENVIFVRRPRPTRLMRPIVEWSSTRGVHTWVRSHHRGRRGFDLIHAHFYSGAGFLPAFRRKTGIPYVITEHSSRLTGLSSRHKTLSRAGIRIARSAYADASKVIVPSTYLASCIERLGLCNTSKLVIVGNPVDTALFHPPVEGTSRDFRIVSVGRLEDDKDPLLLIRAFALALEKESRLRLELIGDGPASHAVRHHVRQRGLEERVTLLGHLPRAQVADRLRGAAIFSLASRIETFCIAAMEAVACGTPVVAPAAGALPELIDETRGIIVPVRDASAIANGILQILARRATFDERKMASFVADHFSHRAVGAHLLNVYRSIHSVRRAALVGQGPPKATWS